MSNPDIENLANTLHPLERKVLPHLKDSKMLNELVDKTGLQEVEVMRALQWLENKQVLTQKIDLKEIIVLLDNGKKYLKVGLPEKRFLQAIKEQPKTIEEIQKEANLAKDEIFASIGLLKQKMGIEYGDKITITEQGKKLLSTESMEEKFLKRIEKEEVELTKLAPEERHSFELLKKRRDFLKAQLIKLRSFELTELGTRLASVKLADNVADALTPAMLKDGSWKDKKFRRFDVEINVPKVDGGRKHPMTAIMDMIRDIFIEMGFEEMKGPWVESNFWCFDSMWVPQNHPARDVQDTFYLPIKGDLPDQKIVKKVAEAHETGGKTGSKGYGYKWDPENAKELLLRTHTTATTFRYLHEKNLKDKETAKYFYIGRIFRNEAIDATHLAEFHQVEGFVMADKLSLNNLMGFIKEFYSKMGIDDIKFKVTYNPYTESSLEALYFDKKRGKWLELINSGMFRPESLEPSGIKKPIVAWGLGLERLAMILYEKGKLKDILGATCDLEWLKRYEVPMRKDEEEKW